MIAKNTRGKNAISETVFYTLEVVSVLDLDLYKVKLIFFYYFKEFILLFMFRFVIALSSTVSSLPIYLDEHKHA